MIAVTGATGAVGGRVASRTADRGLAQRLVVRDPSRAPELAGAEVAGPAEYRDFESMRAALEGVETLFLASASEARDRVDHHRTAVDAAVAAGVERVIYLSFLDAAPDSTFTFGRDHFHTEEHIRASGLAYAFSRQSIYLDFLPGMVGDDGVIRGPAGDGRLAPVVRDDVADVIAALITQPEHDGQAYHVTGPEALSMREIAELLSEYQGREVRYEDETLEQARASRASSGAPDWEIEGWVTSYAAIANGELEKVGDGVPRLTGHEALGVREFLRRQGST